MLATVIVQGAGMSSAFIQVPPGWILITQVGCGTDLLESLSYRIHASPDGSLTPNYTWNFCTDSSCTTPESVFGTGSIVAYDDISNSTPLQSGSGSPECDCTLNSTTAIANGFTPTAPNSLVISQFGAVGNDSLKNPAGMISIFNHANLFGPSDRQSWALLGTSPTGPVTSAYSAGAAASDNIGCLLSTNPGP